MCAHTEHTPTPSHSCTNQDESPFYLHRATLGCADPPLASKWEWVGSGGADPKELLTQSVVRRRALSEPLTHSQVVDTEGGAGGRGLEGGGGGGPQWVSSVFPCCAWGALTVVAHWCYQGGLTAAFYRPVSTSTAVFKAAVKDRCKNNECF